MGNVCTTRTTRLSEQLVGFFCELLIMKNSVIALIVFILVLEYSEAVCLENVTASILLLLCVFPLLLD